MFGLFLIFYGIFRSLVEEFAREPHAGHPMDVGILTPGIVYSLPMIADRRMARLARAAKARARDVMGARTQARRH